MLPLGELKAVDEIQLLAYAHLCKFTDVDAAHRNSQAGRLQAVSVAVRAFHTRHHALYLLFHPLGICFAEAALQIVDDAFKLGAVCPGAPVRLAGHLQLFAAGTVQKRMHAFRRHVLDFGVQRKTVFFAQALVVHLAHRTVRIIPAACLDRALADGKAAVRNNERRVHLHKGTEARACLARAEGIVEREHARRKLVDGNAVLRAGIALAEQHLIASDDVDAHKAARQTDGRLDGIRQAAAHLIIDDEAVHHDLHRVLLVLFKGDLLVQLIHIAIHAHTGKAGTARGLELLLLGALAPAHNGGQHLEPRALGQAQHLVHHLVHRLLADDAAAHRAVRNPDTRIHQAQVIVDFRHRAHCGARVAGGRFLVDGYGRRQALYLVHIRLLHLAQKLAGIAGQAFHVPALSVCVDGIKRQRRFAAARKARHDDEFVAGDGHVHVFEVVLPRAFYHDFVCTQSLVFLSACLRSFSMRSRRNAACSNSSILAASRISRVS